MANMIKLTLVHWNARSDARKLEDIYIAVDKILSVTNAKIDDRQLELAKSCVRLESSDYGVTETPEEIATKINEMSQQTTMNLSKHPGCVCPATSEQTCRNQICPRRSIPNMLNPVIR